MLSYDQDVEGEWTTATSGVETGLEFCDGQTYSSATMSNRLDANLVTTELAGTEQFLEKLGFDTLMLADADDAQARELVAIKHGQALVLRINRIDQSLADLEVAVFVGDCLENRPLSEISKELRQFADQSVDPNAFSPWDNERKEIADRTQVPGYEFVTVDLEPMFGNIGPGFFEACVSNGDIVATPGGGYGLNDDAAAAVDWYVDLRDRLPSEGWQVQADRIVIANPSGPDSERWLLFAVKGRWAIEAATTFRKTGSGDGTIDTQLERQFLYGSCIGGQGLLLASSSPGLDAGVLAPQISSVPNLDD